MSKETHVERVIRTIAEMRDAALAKEQTPLTRRLKTHVERFVLDFQVEPTEGGWPRKPHGRRTAVTGSERKPGDL